MESTISAPLTELRNDCRLGRERIAALRESVGGELERAQEQLLRQVRMLAARGCGTEDDEPLRAALDEAQREASELREDLEQLRSGNGHAAVGDPAEAESLRQELQEAREQIASLQSGGRPARPALDANSSWEEMKQRLLEDGDDEPEERAALEEKIEQTDQIVAHKNQLIEELRAEMQQLRESLEVQGAHCDKVDQVLDDDNVVQEERERLRELQAQWHEKLRAAEVEVSVERAQMARERAQMEERIQQAEAELARLQGSDGSANSNGKRDSGRGRWLARLGLSRDE